MPQKQWRAVPIGKAPRVSDERGIRARHDLHQLSQVHQFAAGRAGEQGLGPHVGEIDDEMRSAGRAVIDLDAEKRRLGAFVEQPVQGLAVVDHRARLRAQADDGILPPDREKARRWVVEAGLEPRGVGSQMRGPVERHPGEHVAANAGKAGHAPTLHTD